MAKQPHNLFILLVKVFIACADTNVLVVLVLFRHGKLTAELLLPKFTKPRIHGVVLRIQLRVVRTEAGHLK